VLTVLSFGGAEELVSVVAVVFFPLQNKHGMEIMLG
jgi:hypothetical protein